MSFVYAGWDVHSYSNQFKKTMEDRNFDFSEPVSLDQWGKLVEELNYVYQNFNEALVAIRTQNNRVKSSEIGKVVDSDLYKCDLARIFLETWILVKKTEDKDTIKGFGEILCDIGGTCLQGATHRLLTYYVALLDSSTINK